jgi:hypothetical protein
MRLIASAIMGLAGIKYCLTLAYGLLQSGLDSSLFSAESYIPGHELRLANQVGVLPRQGGLQRVISAYFR